MKVMKKLILSLILVLLGSTVVTLAQKRESVTIDNYKIEKDGSSVYATITLVNHKSGRNSYKVIAQPILVNGQNSVEMPKLVFRTVRGRILDFRHEVEYPQNTNIFKQGEVVNYSYVFPYKSWMDGAELLVKVELFGCCKNVESPSILVAQGLALAPDKAYVIRPSLAYLAPVSEPKSRVEKGSAFLEFPVGSYKLNGDFANNAYELAKINSSVDVVASDMGAKTVESIELWGTASPEGNALTNARLAQNRAIAVKNYIMNYYLRVTTNYVVTSAPENWSGLVEALKNNTSDWAQDVINTASSDYSDALKNRQIRELNGGVTYKYLLENVYPKLRKVDYKVNYTIRDFTPEEVAQVFEVRPQDLSLAELYNLAKTYPANSDEFYNIIRVSAALYPEDGVANLNAATAALQNGNSNDVTYYLSRADQQSPYYLNTLGALQMLKGDYQNAFVTLKKATKMGIPQARANLEQLAMKLKNIEVMESQM